MCLQFITIRSRFCWQRSRAQPHSGPCSNGFAIRSSRDARRLRRPNDHLRSHAQTAARAMLNFGIRAALRAGGSPPPLPKFSRGHSAHVTAICHANTRFLAHRSQNQFVRKWFARSVPGLGAVVSLGSKIVVVYLYRSQYNVSTSKANR
jgi:hypothetical protein